MAHVGGVKGGEKLMIVSIEDYYVHRGCKNPHIIEGICLKCGMCGRQFRTFQEIDVLVERGRGENPEVALVSGRRPSSLHR